MSSSGDILSSLLQMGSNTLKSKDGNESTIKELSKAAEENPISSDCLIERSEVNLQAKKLDYAFEDAQKATIIDPSNVKSWIALVRALIANNNFRGADFALSQGFNLDSSNKDLKSLEQLLKPHLNKGNDVNGTGADFSATAEAEKVTIARAGGADIKKIINVIGQVAKQTGLLDDQQAQKAKETPPSGIDKLLNSSTLQNISKTLMTVQNIKNVLASNEVQQAGSSMDKTGQIKNISALASNPYVMGLAKKFAKGFLQ